MIDGHWFRQNPSSVIKRLLTIVDIEPMIDFNKLLVFDKKKGFFCQAIQHDNDGNNSNTRISTSSSNLEQSRIESGQEDNGRSGHHHKDNTTIKQHKRASRHNTIKCLGKSKGRKYPEMDTDSRLYLRRYYMPYNRQLANLLSNELKQPLPNWLEDEISFG